MLSFPSSFRQNSYLFTIFHFMPHPLSRTVIGIVTFVALTKFLTSTSGFHLHQPIFSLHPVRSTMFAKIFGVRSEDSSSANTVECPKLPAPVFGPFSETADLCMGWFWGPDVTYSNLDGVQEVTVGYAGGRKSWPTYRNIQDHTEAVRIEYDPNVVTFESLLDVFLNELGGPPVSPSYSRQYRSAILVHNSTQRAIALQKIEQWSNRYGGRKLYIDVEDATDFYRAEEYHQKYMEKQRRRRGSS